MICLLARSATQRLLVDQVMLCSPLTTAVLKAAADMGESDRVGGVISSFCGDAGVRAPCAMPMEFEWRSFMFDFDAEPGKHSLFVKAREDGTR